MYRAATRPSLAMGYTRDRTVKHKLNEDYVARVERFAVLFPAAHRFLRRVQDEGPRHGVWLSTSVNAHLYKEAGFLAYLKLKNPELKPPSLVISPKFNQQIVGHTTDQSTRLFPGVFDELVDAYGGRNAPWALRRANGATELTITTPDGIFGELFAAIVKIEMRDA